MAKKQPTSKYAPQKEHLINKDSIKNTWGIRPPQEWLSLLQEISPSNEWKLKGQTLIVGKCPYHSDATPSFTLSFDKRMGKCFGAGCEKLVTDIVNLVAKLRNCSYAESLLFIYNRFNLGDTIAAKAGEFTKYNQVQEVKKATAIAMSKIVELVLAEDGCPPHLEYCIPAVDYLVSVREIPKAILPMMPVGVVGKPVHMKEFIPAGLHAAYDEYFKQIDSNTYYGCLCFHYNDSPGSISRFKLRHKNQQQIEKLTHFKDYSELPEKEKALLFFKGDSHFLDDPYTHEIGVFGLHRYQTMVGKNDTNAYITEGEFDALSVMAAQFSSGRVDYIMLAIGGKGATDVSFLRDYGIRTIWLVPDHPMKQGDGWAEAVLGAKNNFVSAIGQTPLQFRVFQWPPELPGGDLDEAVKEQGYEGTSEFLFKKRNAHFLHSVAWVCHIVNQKLTLIDQKYDQQVTLLESEGSARETEVSNIENERKGKLQECVHQGLRFVHAPLDKQEYARKYVTDRAIDITQLKGVETAMYDLETMQGVVERVNSHLKEYFEMAYYVKGTGDNTIFAWSKRNEELVEIPTNDKAILKTIALHVGREVEQWFDGMLGNNPVYCEGVPDDTQGILASKKKRQNARTILEKAFEQQMSGIQNYANLKIMSQGIHYHDLPVNLKREGYIYFVNGNMVYRGQFKGAGEIIWERIHNVTDKGVIFEDVTQNQKWSCVDDTTDLFSAPMVDLQRVFDQIKTILNGWKFEHHDIMVEYLAAYIMSLTTMRAIGDINITMLTGGKESGKTTLAGGLLSGSGAKRHECPHILESVFQMDDATLPALYQNMEGKSHLVVIDEAENGKKYTSRKDDNFKEIIRMAHSLPMGGTNILRGGKDKADKKEYFLRFPMLLASINMPADSVFLSRTVIVSTKKNMDHKPIPQYLDEHFTMGEIESLRKDVTLGLLPHIPELIANRKKLGAELLKASKGIARVSNRFMECVITPLTVYQMLGKDPVKLYKDMLRTNKSRLESIHSQDGQSELLTACLYSTQLKITTTENVTDFVSVKSLLMSQDYTAINNSDSGVYFIPEKRWIVIVWRQAKFGVLSKSQFASTEEGALREDAQRNAFVMEEITEVEHNVVKGSLGLRDVQSSAAYSILDLDYLLGAAQAETPEIIPEGQGDPLDEAMDALVVNEEPPKVAAKGATGAKEEEEEEGLFFDL